MICKEAIKALELMKDEWRLSFADAVMDEINLLIFELTFVDIFLELQTLTENNNFQYVSELVQPIVRADLFSKGMEMPAQFHDQLSEMQEMIWSCKSKIRAQYSYPHPLPVLNISDPVLAIDTCCRVEELIDYIRMILEEVMRSSTLASSLAISSQIQHHIFGGLHSLHSFYPWIDYMSQEPDRFGLIFSHGIAVASDVAMIIFLHLPVMNQDSALQETDINSLLTDLLVKRILPFHPCVRRLYVQLLIPFNPDLSYCDADLIVPVTSRFMEANLRMLQHSYSYGLIVPKEDQHTFSEMLNHLTTYLRELPSQGFEFQLNEMHHVIVDSSLFIFSLYDKNDKEKVVLGKVNFDLPGLIQRIRALTYRIIHMSFQSISPKIDGLGFVDFLFDSMKEFLSHSVNNQLEAALKALESLRPFLAENQCVEPDTLQHLATLLIGKAHEIEYIVDCYMTKHVSEWYLTPWLSDLIEEIELVKAKVKNIKEDKACTAQKDNITNVSTPSQLPSMTSIAEEIVGFNDVVQTLRDQLVRGMPRELDIISIVGAHGLGKTTVADKLFNDELVVSLFDVRAICYVPIGYECRDLLVTILRDVVDKPTDFSEVPEDDLVDKLQKLLLPKRYLVLVDNVNDPGVWDYLISCFPNANNGSRIILTTRLGEVANKARRVSSPHYLRMFSDEESWMLLQNMVFPRQSCPPSLITFGLQLAKRCEGLPFRVAVMAGALSKLTTEELELLAKGDKDVKKVFSKATEVALYETHNSLPKNSKNAFRGCISSQLASTIAEDMVGFEDVLKTMIDQLVGGTPERDVISITGMAGQGKTTIANKLFADESVVSRFDIHARCYVSQVYERRELLIALLSDVVNKPTDLSEVPEDELADKLRKLLLRKRYLILIDDAWETRVWDELQSCFPDDKNGSRIIVTTRLDEVANCASSPHHLRLFSDAESWTLLRKKVFLQQSCPPDLKGVGQEISKKCAGLPLSIVLVAGVLASMTKKEQWEQVADSLGSHILGDSRHIVQFSYKNLPHYLRPCFLYFGAFLEDKEIQTSKLTKLWVAEGLILKRKEKCLADMAEDYLEELIKRNMVTATKKGSLGQMKACRIHDLLLEFCKEKAKEEKFLLWIYRDEDASSINMLSQMLVPRRVSIYSKQFILFERSPSCSNVHSILFRKVGDDVVPSVDNRFSFPFHCFKCLRVLDLEFVTVDSFPTELSRLRYLALRTAEKSVPSSIANQRDLETLVVKGPGTTELSLPHSLCKMVKLRHLHITERASFDMHNLKKFLEDPSQLENLETFSTLGFLSGEDVERVLRKTPNLRKVRFMFSLSQFPKLQHLAKLETLKALCFPCPERSPCEFNFPSDLKKLTLSGFKLPWSEISVISELSSLVVLQLQSDAFCGEEWEVRDEEFSQLKVLKLENISFAQWIISEDAFCNLEQLVLHSCDCLVEIPSEFGYLNCLRSIEVKSCQESVADSVRGVEEIQVDEMQNCSFKLFIF